MMGDQADAKGGKTRVLVVDDHPIIREGLGYLIDNEPDLMMCGAAADAYKALEAIPALKPDVVIVDISLKNGDGIGLIKDIKVRYGKLPILVLSMHDESVYAERALRAGAKGYVMKHESIEKVLEGIRRVRADQIYVSEGMTARLLRKLVNGQHEVVVPAMERLSDRELQVFGLIGQGFGTREISEKLHVSVKTVESHREHIKDKLRLRNASDLLQHAIQWMRSQH
jgi:DNA-binding NarL/FixJ family response regulator